MKIGTVAKFSYDRSYMTTQRTRNHDGETVTVISEPFVSAGLTFVTVENQFNSIYPVMTQELTAI